VAQAGIQTLTAAERYTSTTDANYKPTNPNAPILRFYSRLRNISTSSFTAFAITVAQGQTGHGASKFMDTGTSMPNVQGGYNGTALRIPQCLAATCPLANTYRATVFKLPTTLILNPENKTLRPSVKVTITSH
jgi:hypothetical protein